ncbi:sigma-54 dependent transcriptional regulator [Bradyrhizobium sediminis]|uniref:Sigma-54 dependent transcriptional regulator n=1 Tax=Bradyrhizobium sediminis TaxID=2840469 RepID=A0A975NWA2_9BRAD|nr:sigma-54 dependent transcriptional regulator [Bradyrhizobium sediminis]QWG22553.1 sigma-54 dependent transcriptional regulator [Bradyrhizobium sediminis]
MSHSERVIGLVEDDQIMGESIVQRLALEGVTVKWWQCGRDAIREIPVSKLEAIVCDIRLPDLNGEDVFRESARSSNVPPFLFITGHGDIDQAVRLMRAGAADYFMKPFELDDFLIRIGELMGPPPASGTPVLGFAPKMKELERLLTRVAKLNSTVLIAGETGSGKEVAARFLHAMSASDSRPFMAVNCAAIPGDLLESELLGHEKGAFTGASQRHLGYAERAGEGILFLDEIGELRSELQAKLLRLIEDRSFYRVGGERPIPFNGRLVVATNADLPKLVEAGRFREDLYYRINVVSVRIPPLRERQQDIPWLMERFFAESAGRMETSLKGISSLAEEAALSYAWPGNIRELRNRMERAVALGLGQWVMPGDMFPEQSEGMASAMQMGSLEDVRQSAEKRHIIRALLATHGEVGAASKLLGIGRTTLWEKMRRLGLNDGDPDL